MGEGAVHPLVSGVVVVVTGHIGPYKAFLRGEVGLGEAVRRSAELDRAAGQSNE